jgi:hypothetical protein
VARIPAQYFIVLNSAKTPRALASRRSTPRKKVPKFGDYFVYFVVQQSTVKLYIPRFISIFLDVPPAPLSHHGLVAARRPVAVRVDAARGRPHERRCDGGDAVDDDGGGLSGRPGDGAGGGRGLRWRSTGRGRHAGG